MKRRALVAASLASSAVLAQSKETPLAQPDSLRRVAELAWAKGAPLVLLSSLPGCPYCEVVRRNYLVPMRAEGTHAWQLNVMDDKTPMLDFEGQRSTAAKHLTRIKARFTPTVLFVGSSPKLMGQELVERLMGFGSADFYGAYLDERILEAKGRLVG